MSNMLPRLTDKQTDWHITWSSTVRHCQKPQQETCVTEPVSCHGLVYQMTSDKDKVRPECPHTFCNVFTPSGKLTDKPGSDPQLCCQLCDLLLNLFKSQLRLLQNRDKKHPCLLKDTERTGGDHVHESHSPESGT